MNRLQKIVSVFLILLGLSIGYFLFFSSDTYNISIDYSGSFNVNEPLVLNIKTTQHLQKKSPKELNFRILHAYDKSDSFENVISQSLDGEYTVIFTPSNAGDYNIAITITDDGKTQTFNDKVTIN